MRPFSCAVCALNALQNSMMLTPCWPSAGPTGGAGLAWPPGIWSLISVRTFFAITSVQFLDLVERELDRYLSFEDVDQHLELLLVRVDVDDLAVEVGERARGDLDGLTERVLHGRPRPLGGRDAGVQDPVDLALRQRHRLGTRADEAGHAGRVLHDRPGVVVEVHVDEQVARVDALLRLNLLAVLRLDHLLGRHDDAAEPLRLVHGDDPVLEIGLHLVLVPGVRVDDDPLEHSRLPQQHFLDESLKDLIGSPQVGADDDAGDEHDDRALDHLLLPRPFDLAQLAPGLRQEMAPARLRRMDWLGHGSRHLRLARSARARRGGIRLRPALPALVTRLSRHYLVSRWAVCRPHQRQYLLNSTRSGVFRLDLFVW